jgi:hypothetical protein
VVDAPGLEQAEFEQVNAARRLFDIDRWMAAVAARRRMQRWNAVDLDLAVAEVTRKGIKAPVFIGSKGMRANVSRAKPDIDASVEVQVVQVTVRGSYAAGTLVVPIATKAIDKVDPRSLALHRWNEQTRQYDLVHQSGVDLSGGFVYGRISGSGRYAVLGLPLGDAVDRVVGGAGAPILGRMLLYLLFRRLFDPTGPWSPLGPINLSCCIMDFAIDPANDDRIYAAASDGGVWRLDSLAAYPDATWTPVTDGQPSLQIQVLAVSPADNHVVYYVDRSGILRRSEDRGDTWATPGTANIGSAQRLIAHPTDPNTVYVATTSGFWCTHDGGATWAHNAGASTLLDGDMLDAAMDPDSALILYVAQRSVGVRKSYDGGATWQLMLPWSRATAPSWTAIRIGLGKLGTDATRTVAVRFDQEVFVNRNGGRDVVLLGGGPWVSRGPVGGTGYGDWCHVIAVDPFDDNIILSGAQQLYRTADGGNSWTLVIDYYQPHEDQHRIVFDLTQSGVVYAANDGGVFRSTDKGASWQVDSNDVINRRDLTHGLVTAQFYTAAISGDHALGDLYHQGIAAADSLRLGQWEGVEGHAWEFNRVYGDPTRGGTYYVFGGTLFRRDFPGGALTSISPFTPTVVAVDSGKNLLAGASDGTIHRTPDPTIASPVWTTMAGLAPSGDTIAAIAFAPSSPGRAYAASSGGRIFCCADTGTPTAWVARTSLPGGGVVALAVAAEDASLVFAATSSQVYRSVDGGGTWTAVNGSGTTAIPPGSSLHSLVIGPAALYVLATAGVFTTADRGNHWYDFSAGLPNVELMELIWTESDLFAVTHGRGIWHHGRYEAIPIPGRGALAHAPDAQWLIALWLAIHGGDPSPEAIQRAFGQKVAPFVSAEARG